MKKRIRKAIRKLRAGRPRAALRALGTPHHSEIRIDTARARIADHLKELHGNTVAHGPFAGLRLPERSGWGRHDVSAKILGTYERQVVDLLVAWSAPGGVLVDLGAADGYLAVGALRAGLFAEAICFERSEKGRATLQAVSEQNGVGDRLRILGEATPASLLEVLDRHRPDLLLCDIEGAEFDLLDEDVLHRLSNTHVIVELHEFLVEDGLRMRRDLEARAARVFDVEIVGGSDPAVSGFPELDGFDDDHRLLAFSEGRDVRTDWLVLRPRPAG